MKQNTSTTQEIFEPKPDSGEAKEPTIGGSPDDMVSIAPVEKVWGRWRDGITAILLGVICFLVLFFTIEDYGITWDEAAPNFVAARNQAEWFRNFFSFEHPFSKEIIDQYWSSPSTHPSLTRTLMAGSLIAFGSVFGEIVALRLPSVLLAALLVAVLYLWLARRVSPVAALGAVLIWVTLPRVFGHLHIASLDVPMMVWWALTVVVFYEGAQKPLISRWHLLTGIIYGLALSTKLHSFFLPIPLVVWMLLQKRWHAWRNLVAMATVGPLVYLVTQVYLWHDFWPRLLERYITYSSKDSIAPVKILYFGRQFADSTPWHYPLVMTLLTTPIIVIFFTILGTIVLTRMKQKSGMRSLIALNVLVPASLITLPHAQGYDGIRLILPAMPWIAVIAGLGFDRIVEWGRQLTAAKQGVGARMVLLLCFLGLYIPSWWTLRQNHPFHLEYYAEWIGGYPAALRMGMESTYWCNTLLGSRPTKTENPVSNEDIWDDWRERGIIERLNHLPDQARLKTLSMSEDALRDYQRLGFLKDTIIIDGPPPYDYHLLQCRQGFFGRIEWAFYQGQLGAPLATISHREVPFFMLFGSLPDS